MIGGSALSQCAARSMNRRGGRLVRLCFAALAFNIAACSHPSRVDQQGLRTGALGSSETSVSSHPEVAEVVYDNGLKNQWMDFGWSPRELSANGPAKIKFNDYGGWIVAKPGLDGNYGGVLFRVKEPAGEGEFLEVGLWLGGTKRPHVKITPDDTKDVGDGWTEVFLSMDRLNPGSAPFDRVVLQAFRPVSSDWVFVNNVGLVRGSSAPPSSASTGSDGGPRGATAYAVRDAKPLAARLACDAKATKISPLIYGAGGTDIDSLQRLHVTIGRWGGNPTSTYNWEARAWNVGKDWFFENHSAPAYTQFLGENASHEISSALTVPILGWVAKDASSNGFPVSVYGPQAATDQWRPDAGNGVRPSGAKLNPSLPPQAGVAAPPALIKRWISEIASADAKSGKRSVTQYILDNEPMIWHETHRSMHPSPVGYDEYLQRAIDYGTAIREADPTAVIAGPAEWGWTNYFYSAIDVTSGGTSLRPDRRAHGDVSLIEWYLRKLREHEQKTGVRILDVVDVHYYPQANNVYGNASDPATSSLRLRSTRSLWDKTYLDESWINDKISLLPRMKDWVDKNYPGRGISIGEWNFGGEGHISGALAIAETLGRFAQFGVASAFYWTAPPAGSPGTQGFLTYRNFDGKGGHFLDWYLPTTSASGDVSLFASRDEAGKHVVLVAINLSPNVAMLAQIDTGSCGAAASRAAYSFVAGAPKFELAPAPSMHEATLEQVLPPWSITVIDLDLAQPLRGELQR
jgi:hypothetical protein